MNPNFDGVCETLLIPLYARAKESKQRNHDFYDSKAVEIVSKLNYDFSNFENATLTYHGTVARTIIFDREVGKYIQKHPNCICISIGCGLDSRFSRVDNGTIQWYDIDLPEVIQVRKHFFKNEDRYSMIACSALDKKWAENIQNKNPHVLIIIEGVLMYFTAQEVSILLNIIKNRFGSCDILMETMNKAVSKRSSMHDSVKKTNAIFRWGINDFHEVEQLLGGIRFIKAWNLTDEMVRRLPFHLKLVTPIMRKFNNNVAHYKII